MSAESCARIIRKRLILGVGEALTFRDDACAKKQALTLDLLHPLLIAFAPSEPDLAAVTQIH